ncbi:AFG2-interacting ribosome maturation factor isoform X1 [Scleropages formosus]|uniref:AFG2 interacting ribosome maturation factor n=2 Tax=Scleropages formosus TaxID=113540 RepID=A0A8C9SEV2_SCLFO|nr:uncharacterized protein C1orf109 homolog isoform X1 [Scleropages formosus]
MFSAGLKSVIIRPKKRRNLTLMSTCALSSLHHALKRSFEVLEQTQERWNGALSACSPLLVSLGNLGEQMRALQRAPLERTPMRAFPDLRPRLRFKLLQAADALVGKLLEQTSVLQSLRDMMSNQAAAVFQLYAQHADALELSSCLRRSATCPSVADMMGWLQDAERYYHNEFLKRKVLLETLRPNDVSDLQTSPKRWESLTNQRGDDCITETLCRVAFFRES